jgi:hypothetical protein
LAQARMHGPKSKWWRRVIRWRQRASLVLQQMVATHISLAQARMLGSKSK